MVQKTEANEFGIGNAECGMKGAGGIEFWIVSTWRIEQRATRKAIQQTPIVDLSLCAVRYGIPQRETRNS